MKYCWDVTNFITFVDPETVKSVHLIWKGNTYLLKTNKIIGVSKLVHLYHISPDHPRIRDYAQIEVYNSKMHSRMQKENKANRWPPCDMYEHIC